MTIKQYLTKPPILASPRAGDTLYLYLTVSEVSVSAALFKEDENRKQRPIFFISKSLTEAETQYTHLEQTPLALRVARPYPTRPKGLTRSGDTVQFFHIYIFEYYINKYQIIISIKEDSSFCQLTLSFNMTCMSFQHYHLQNIIRVHIHK